MRPAFHHELAAARVAGLHHHAARERTARAARRAGRARQQHRTGPAPAVTALARRVLTLARGRRPAPAR
jgi:hypothetical protein